MTDFPITLDDRRTTAGKLEILTHRRAANTRSTPETFGDPVETELNSAMSAAPPEAPNVRIRKLIARAMCDLTRLKKQEENAP